MKFFEVMSSLTQRTEQALEALLFAAAAFTTGVGTIATLLPGVLA
jgi:hypothetical protein